jgi:hypothetical protein
MQKNNVIRSLQSFIVLPFLAMNLIAGPGLDIKLPTVGVSSLDEKGTLSEEAVNQQHELEAEAAKIDKYFADRNLPAAGLGMKMVLEAKKNGLDWRILPALLMIESTGNKNTCPNDPDNGFGWNSCYGNFDSVDHAIEVVAFNISGNNPKTEHYYKNKDIDGILRAYNSVNPKYNGLIKSVMKTIENYNLS